MRIKVEGKITTDRVMEVLKDLMRRAPQDSVMTGFNMYLTVRDSNDYPVDFLNDDGTPMEMLVYREKRHAVPLRAPKRPVKRKPQLKLVKGAPRLENAAKAPPMAAAANQ
jgi:hypothetical protein